MGTLQGKSIIVTGAAGAIGSATAAVLAREGARLMLVDVNGEQLAARAQQIAAMGAEVQAVRADVSRGEEVRSFVEATRRSYGRVDGLFNNAGVEGHIMPTWEYDEAEFDRITRVNVNGVFLGMRHVIPVMLEQGSGAIVNTASIGSERGLAGACTYNASKHAVVGLTRTAAAEAGPKGIRVNCVMPGVIDTPLLESVLAPMFNGDIALGKKTLGRISPLERIGQPVEIGEVVAFLLSDAASFVTGAAWSIDGGALCTIRH
ncbi:MAG: glucose 1-dehydrogenase [Nevskiaceae bacterium]|jgi:NAD(P)-dependent dehydrogenase (short-subunit alcohol dehydrogenase family)|nr:glucose 1-dehydrogenase [Nevskiaceae bacterium]